jgi:hypothetical protein
VICFASAAALTLGEFTAPIYEVYKVGVPDLYWLEGLDLMGALGLRCAVVPHFDNREGSNYDTRYCYLGEPRLRALEEQLPDGVGVLGVDEHTALLLDLASDTLTVKGRGGAYWRVAGQTRTLERGAPTPIAALRNATAAAPQRRAAPQPEGAHELDELALRARGDGPEAVEALAQLVHRASQAGEGRIDPADLVAGVLRARDHARSMGLYDLADELRSALVAAGIEISDSPLGSTWSVR